MIIYKRIYIDIDIDYYIKLYGLSNAKLYVYT